MFNRTRDDFIRVIRKNLKTGADRAVALAKSAFKLIQVLLDPMKASRINSASEKVLKKHPVLGLLSGFAGAIAIVPVTTAIFGTSTAIATVLASAAFAWVGSMWLGTAAMIFGPSILVTVFKVTRNIAKFVIDAASFVLSLVIGLLAMVTLMFATFSVICGTLATFAVTAIHKLIWAISLLLQTPAMLLDRTALPTWKQYAKSWTPQQFTKTSMSSVFTKLPSDEAIVMNFPVGKNRPTNRQVKRPKPLGPINQMGTA